VTEVGLALFSLFHHFDYFFVGYEGLAVIAV